MEKNKLILITVVIAVIVLSASLLKPSGADYLGNIFSQVYQWFAGSRSIKVLNDSIKYIDIPDTVTTLTSDFKVVSPHPPFIYVETYFGNTFASVSFPSYDAYESLVLKNPKGLRLDLKESDVAVYRNTDSDEVEVLNKSLKGILGMMGGSGQSKTICGNIFAQIGMEVNKVPLTISLFEFHVPDPQPYQGSCPGLVALYKLIYKTKTPGPAAAVLPRACGIHRCKINVFDNKTWEKTEVEGQCQFKMVKGGKDPGG